MPNHERDDPSWATSSPQPAAGYPSPKPRHRTSRRLLTIAVVLALLAGCGYVGYQLLQGPLAPMSGPFRSAIDPPDRSKRPNFQVPFGCGERWQLTTYAQHNPEDKKVDFFRASDRDDTAGTTVRASAAGRVVLLPDPGGVKIDHGQGWYTLYLHMDGIAVQPGEELDQGTPIGKVGAVGSRTAHLHYEQLFDADGNGRVSAYTDELVYPVLQGEEFRLEAAGSTPVLKSANACALSPSRPPEA